MTKRSILTTMILALSILSGAQESQQQTVKTYVIKYRTKEAAKARASIPKSQRIFKIKRQDGDTGIEVVSATPDQIRKAEAAADVELVVEDEVFRVQDRTNDPLLPAQYALAKLRAPRLWDFGPIADGVVVAVIDSGVDPEHPDLKPFLLPGFNTLDNSTNTADDNGHGTAVAGCITAVTDNKVGIAGLAQGARILPIKAADRNGYATSSSLYSALVWAADHGAKVANLSFKVSDSTFVRMGMQYFVSKGGVVTVSAGNYNSRTATPDNPDCLTVTATTPDDTKASWSDYGTNTDVAAPGLSIKTTSRGGVYSDWSGTSFSAPIAAGVAACVIGANPSLTPKEVMDTIKRTATDVGAPGWDEQTGWGRIDAFAAVVEARKLAGEFDTPPAVTIDYPTPGAVLYGKHPINITAEREIDRLRLYIDGKLWRTFTERPFSLNWSTLAVPDALTEIKAVGLKNGLEVSKDRVYVRVSNYTDSYFPQVKILNLENSAQLAGGFQTLRIEATDNRKVKQVRVLMNDKLWRTFYSEPYVFKWSAKAIPNGPLRITVEAIDDTGNKTTVFRDVVISNFDPNMIDDTPPLGGFTNLPKFLQQKNQVSFEVSDNIGVASVRFHVGNRLVRTMTTWPSTFTFELIPEELAQPELTIRLLITDMKGNTFEDFRILKTLSQPN